MCALSLPLYTQTDTEREREREVSQKQKHIEGLRGFGVWFIFICFCVKVYWVLILFKEWIRMEVYNSSSNYL